MRPPRLHLLALHFLVLAAGLGASFQMAKATHNLAGDITYDYLGNNTVEITVTTYTDPSAFNVDRCDIDLEIWNAAGTVKITDITDIPRQNGPFFNDPNFPISCPTQQMGEYIFGSVKKNIYKTQYTFSGPGWYLVRFHDLARLENIVNMVNSGNQEFFIETTILINNYIGPENSPRFLNHPIDQACTGKRWTHNPGGWDPDGDSLDYKLVPCRQYDGTTITTPITCTGYVYPDDYQNNGPFVMDPVTGLITWDVPQVQGIYAIAYVIEEYRDGVLIGRSFRDMAIFVNPCDNNPPVIEAIIDTCIFAGETLVLPFKVWDPDFDRNPPPGDSIYFYQNNNGQNNNGPFAVANSPAQLVITRPSGQQIPPAYPVGHNDTIAGTITWSTLCEHVRPAFYQIDFYVHDNLSYYGEQMLSTHHVIKVQVLPRPVTGLSANVANRDIVLTWDPHPCNTATGYEVFRRVGGGGYTQDSICCESDPASAGFQLIGTTTGHGSTTFTDNGGNDPFPYGAEICYLVRATFDDNLKTCASNLACVQIEKDFPVILKDSVDVTASSGRIAVAWSKPSAIDTAFFPRPFTYSLHHATGLSGAATWVQVAAGIPYSDTTFLHSGPDTEASAHRYRIDVHDATGQVIGEGNVASSIFLSITPGDKQLRLDWVENVPWENRQYDIYRADQAAGPYVLIATVAGTGASSHTYLDRGLTNFEDYCYVVVSEGEYATNEVPDSVRNASQRVCAVPVDLEPPCVGTIDLDTTKDCVAHTITFDWTEPDSICGADVDFYNIYRADNRQGTYALIATVDSGQYSFSVPNIGTIADCYGVSAVDTNGNESPMLIYCFENCPEVTMSNVFTPNGDGINDYFSPFSERNIRITLVQIYDRWGALVYTTNAISDHLQLWDGRNNKGANVPDGVYYYVVRYEEERLPGYVIRPALNGHLTLLR